MAFGMGGSRGVSVELNKCGFTCPVNTSVNISCKVDRLEDSLIVTLEIKFDNQSCWWDLTYEPGYCTYCTCGVNGEIMSASVGLN